jgi:hypothetical protein
MPHLARICIYPIKSLDGVILSQATILPSGALKGDREFAIFDEQGKVVNGKRTAKVHSLRSSFDLEARTVTLQVEGREQAWVFHLDAERKLLSAWLSDYFGYAVQVLQNLEMGFPDDTHASGPTLISTETLKAVNSWFPELDLEDLRSRFRTNLEIAEVPPFWEDHLFTAVGDTVPFQVGDVRLEGVNPCQRCIVPTRNALRGEVYANFQKIFVAKRRETLPAWALLSRFNHFYRLAINTQVPESEAGKTVRIEDLVQGLKIGRPPFH